MAKKKSLSRQMGLEVGLIVSRYLLKTEELHFGYWPEDLEVEVLNLPEAQENHSDLINSHLPIETGRILEEGCGAGTIGRKLIDRGFSVDGVIPSAFLAGRVREVFGGRGEVFECRLEDLKTEKKYDLILFSESFQYVDIKAGLAKADELLDEGGHVLICDFFDRQANAPKSVRGGHKWPLFKEALSHGPWEKKDDVDITNETGPTLDLVNDVMNKVALPICALCDETFKARHSILSKILHWKFKKRIEKARARYFGGRLSSSAFSAAKTYRLLVFRKKGGPF